MVKGKILPRPSLSMWSPNQCCGILSGCWWYGIGWCWYGIGWCWYGIGWGIGWCWYGITKWGSLCFVWTKYLINTLFWYFVLIFCSITIINSTIIIICNLGHFSELPMHSPTHPSNHPFLHPSNLSSTHFSPPMYLQLACLPESLHDQIP